MKANTSARLRSKQIAKQHGFVLQNSYIVYLGPSMIDSSVEVVGIVSGFLHKSKNTKTSDVLQVTYIRTDMHPQDAINIGADQALCGTCPFTKTHGNGVRLCYVRMQPVFSQYHKFCRGGYELIPTMDLFNGWHVRLGTYGDPACCPVEISQDIKNRAASTKGYTHSWKVFPELANICMASVERDQDFVAASILGFKCFRVRSQFDDRLFQKEILCMNTQRGLNCQDCPFCEGCQDKALHVAVSVHGPRNIVSVFNQRFV
jgi:hypothetical protein